MIKARFCCKVKWSRQIVGTVSMPSDFAASTRPCPATIIPPESTSTGLVKPNDWILACDLMDLLFWMGARVTRPRPQRADR